MKRFRDISYTSRLQLTIITLAGLAPAILFFSWLLLAGRLDLLQESPWILGGLALLAFAGILVSRHLTKPVRDLVEKAAKTPAHPSLDELGGFIDEIRQQNEKLTRENRRLREEAQNSRIAAARAEQDARTAMLANRRHLGLLNREIRTPLNGVMGIVELLLDSDLDARAQRLVRTLHHSVESLLDLIRNSLDTSGLEKVDPTLEKETFDLRRLVTDTVQPFRRSLLRKGPKLITDISDDLPKRVIGDPLRLSQMLESLLRGAVGMAENGDLQLRVVPQEKRETLCHVEFQVCMDAEDVSHDHWAFLFDSFHRDEAASKPVTTEHRDLVVTSRLAAAMEGFFELRDDHHDSPCLVLNIPLEVVPAGSISPVGGADAEPARRTSVLLVEDNAVNQMITVSMLEALGCAVRLAADGHEAIQLSRNESFDIVFMDCHMPGMDGFTASRLIRENEKSTEQRRTPIIALTADVHEGIHEQCRLAGMDDYISKPYSREDLAKAITKWTSRPAAAVKEESPAFRSEEPLLDSSRLESLRSMGQERGSNLLEKAARHYIDHTPEELKRLEQAIKDNMAENARLIAHNLKSSSDMLGARTIARHFGKLERMALESRLGHAGEIMHSIREMLPEVMEALEEAIHVARTQVHEPGDRIEASGRILLVDDDPAFRLVTAASLREAGFVVEEATNGNEALNLISSNPPELILLDALMEDIDGFEICSQIQENPDTRQIPVLMVTGLEDTDSVHKAFQAGAAGFITKPVNYPVLIHRIRFQLRVARESTELRESREQLAIAQQLARLGHWRWQPAQDRFEMSEQLARICELENDKRIDSLDDFLALVDAEDREQLRLNIASAIDHGTLRPIDYRLTTGSGKKIFIHQELTIPTPGTLLGTVQDVTRQYESEQKIRKLAYSDELTGLASRSYFQRHLEDTINIAGRHEEKFSLLYLDLDSFKDINDTLGHDVGDQLLKVVAERLSKVLRKTDFAARLGGDEFCILVDNVSINYAAEIASRCLEEVNKPIQLGSQTFNPRISIGIANFPGDGRDAQTLLKAADSAMYAAKQEGKHRYAFYQPELTLRAKKRLDMEHELRMALEEEQLELHYQPQVSLSTGTIFGVEALVRWRHPQKGLIPPNEFIHVAERIGLIKKLGRWVLETACSQVMEWARSGHPHLQVAINISPLHFKDPAIVQQVKAALERSGCSPTQLELEVTENVVQTEPDNMESFRRLKELGIRIAIDDFGTGYSSLSSLKKLPIDCLKVDQLFIRGMVDEPESATLVGTIVGLAKALGLQVVAEGVETEQEIQILTGLGCDVVQGYYFSRPVTAEEIPGLLDKGFSHLTPASVSLGEMRPEGNG